MNPPAKANGDDARFRGRDWRQIQVSEIIDPAEVRFVEMDTSIEDTTKLLIKSGAPNLVLVRESTKTRTAIGTFDYSDLNAYLLLVLGLSLPDESAQHLSDRARAGQAIPMADLLDHLGAREMPAFLPHTADLTQAMEVLGGGSHRLIICKEGTSEVVGIVSQLRLVRFFWENHQNFSATEALYSRPLQELKLGAKVVVSINGDRPLKDALLLMHAEGITSLPVLDNHKNVIGNISHVDVKVSSIHLVIVCETRVDVIFAAAHRQLIHPSPRFQLHPFHLYHPLRTRPQRRSGLIPRLPRDALQHPRPHSRQTLRHSLTPHVDRRLPIAGRIRPTKPWLPSCDSARWNPKHAITGITATSSRRSHAHYNTRHSGRRHRPRRCRFRRSAPRPKPERSSHGRRQSDRRPEPLCPRKRTIAQRSGGRAPAPPPIQFKLFAPEHGQCAE